LSTIGFKCDRKTAESGDRQSSTVIENNTNCTTTTGRFFLSTSLMAGVILLETAVPFDAAEWIGVRKLYKDVTIEVSDACCDTRKINAKFPPICMRRFRIRPYR
jgi:hypothetical protein